MTYDELMWMHAEPVTDEELRNVDPNNIEIEVVRQSEYVAISNDFLLHADLSLKAKGLLALLMVLPKKFKPSVRNLCRVCKEGETAIESALDELKAAHYFLIHKFNPGTIGNSTLTYKYYVYEHPYFDAEHERAFHEAEMNLIFNRISQGDDCQGVENHPLDPTEKEEREERSGEEEEKEERHIKKNKEEEEGKKESKEGRDCEPIEIVSQNGNLFDDDFEPVKEQKVSRKTKKFIPPTLEEVTAYCNKIGSKVDPQMFMKWYTATGWKSINGDPVRNWKLKIQTWNMKDKADREFSAEVPETAAPPEPKKLPKKCLWALEELGMQNWLKYKDDFVEGARALAKWHKETVEYNEHWVCVYYPEDFWKSYLSYIFDVTDGRAPSNGHFLPGGKMHQAWLKEMDL